MSEPARLPLDELRARLERIANGDRSWALSQIDTPEQLAEVLIAIIDAIPQVVLTDE